MRRLAPPTRPAAPFRRRLFLLLTLAALVAPLASCSLPEGSRSEASATPDRREPADADMTRLKRQMAALPYVTSVDLNYKPETFGYSARYFGMITSNAKDPTTLIATSDEAYRIVWAAGDIEMGVLDFFVKNPTTGRSAGALDLGMTTPPRYEELEKRYGPRPSPAATATADSSR